VRGSVTAKCTHGHKRAEGRCSGRCLRWYFVRDAPPGPDGRRRRQWSAGHPTRKAAETALREELHRRDQGIMLSAEKVTMRSFAGRWLDYMAILGRDQRTLERYRELLELHALPTIGGLHLKALQPMHLSDLYGRLLREGRRDGRPGGLHPRTVGHIHRVIHRMLKQALRWQLIARNPAADLELPSVPKLDMVTLTREQAGELLLAAERRPLMRALVMLGMATGARLGELLALRRADVDLDLGTARIGRSRRIVGGQMQVKGPKTEAGYRTVALGPVTVATLRRLRTEQAERRLALGTGYHTGEDLVICKPDGRPYRPDSTSTQFRKFVDQAGLPRSIHVHMLRHSAASFLAAEGVPAGDIAAQLGHADGGALALRVYVHPLEENKRRAAAISTGSSGARDDAAPRR
jgi:integrase